MVAIIHSIYSQSVCKPAPGQRRRAVLYITVTHFIHVYRTRLTSTLIKSVKCYKNDYHEEEPRVSTYPIRNPRWQPPAHRHTYKIR